MATTTPNYGWTVPTSTDLVKDGATAIETLGDAIDASMNTALGTKKAGMVLLNTTSFSGVSSQSINDVFSATYRNYKIICNFAQSAVGYMQIRVRVSGTDDTGSNYKFAAIGYKSSNAPYNDYGSTTSWQDLGTTSTSTSNTFFVLDVINPFEAMPTIISGKSVAYDTATSGVLSDINYSGWHTQATSYTALNLIPNTGTITGTAKIYGYN